MAASRKEKIAYMLKVLDDINPGNSNVESSERYFNSLSDKAFNDLMAKMASGEVVWPYYQPNMGKESVSTYRLKKVADKMGIGYYQRITTKDYATGVPFTSTAPRLILPIRVRRLRQHVVKGKAVSATNAYTDPLTGQAVGISRTTRLSLPEINMMESGGWRNSIEEFIKVRGGDNVALREARRQVIETGEYSLRDIEKLGTRPTVTDTLRAVLLAMHYENNI